MGEFISEPPQRPLRQGGGYLEPGRRKVLGGRLAPMLIRCLGLWCWYVPGKFLGRVLGISWVVH
jgi:hypothetical protein